MGFAARQGRQDCGFARAFPQRALDTRRINKKLTNGSSLHDVIIWNLPIRAINVVRSEKPMADA